MSGGHQTPPGGPRWYDFHIHTTCSDGADSPLDILRKAEEAGIEGLSITDHDTLDAYAELDASLLASSRPWVLPGVELSTRLGAGEAHIIGYFPDGLTAELSEYVESVLAKRTVRIAAGIRGLRERGYCVSMEDCEEIATGRVVNLNHLARVLVKKRYISRSHRAYDNALTVVPPPGVEAADAIGTVRDLGGISVWAHPSRQSVEEHLDELIQAGLSGVEVYIPRRKASERRALAQAVRAKGLLVTGGSDTHGSSHAGDVGSFRVEGTLVVEFLERVGRTVATGE